MAKGSSIAVVKTLIFTVVVPCSVTIYVPYWLLSRSPALDAGAAGPIGYLGAVLVLLGAATYFWCAWDFTFAGGGTPAPIDPPRVLVARGLYRYSRNPMYVGILAVLIGEAILLGSRAILHYAAGAAVVLNLWVIGYEERDLARRFGDSYRQYLATVPRWLPWPPARRRTGR